MSCLSFNELVCWIARRVGWVPTVNTMGQWNPLQQMQTIQALQTLASLGVGQVGQQPRLFQLKGQQLGQHGQVVKNSMP
jgi:hypothetical protein